MKTLIGKLHCLIALPEDEKAECEHCLDFELESGEIIPNVKAHPDCPLETLIEATFDELTITDWSVLEPEGEELGEVRIALIAVSKTDEGVEKMRQRLERDAGKIEAAARRQTNTPFVMELHAIKVTNTPHISSSMFWQEVQIKVGSYDKYWVWGGSRSGFCGHAYVSSSRAITYSNCAWYSFGHEGPGHSGIKKRKGLGHSGAGTSAYGERDSFMGNGMRRYGWNMPMLEYLEQIPDAALHIIGEGDARQVHLIDPQTDEIAVYKGLWKGVVIDKAFTQKYRVAYLPYDQSVRVYRPEPKNRATWGATWMLAKLKKGEVYDTDIYVEYLDFNEGVATVDVRWNKDAGPTHSVPIPTAPISEVPINKAKTGLWHCPSQDYQGLDLHIIDTPERKEIAGYWYLHDNYGNNVWLLLQGKFEGSEAVLAVAHVKNGQLDIVGEARLYFHSDELGIFRFWVDIPWIGRDGFAIRRLNTPVADGLYGIWQKEGTKHQGLSVTVNHHTDPNVPSTIQAFWYREGQWHLIDGKIGGELTVYEIQEAFYKVKVSRSRAVAIGKAWLEPAKFTVEIDGQRSEYRLKQLA